MTKSVEAMCILPKLSIAVATATTIACGNAFLVYPLPGYASSINGIHRCLNGSRITVSGYKDWNSGSINVNWQGKNYKLKNYYKDAWGESPASPNGYMDTGTEFKFAIRGKIVCRIR